MKRRPDRFFTLGIFEDLEPALLVERRGFLPRVFDWHGVAFQFYACLKPVLLVRSLIDRNPELYGLPSAGPVDAKNIPQVAVAALIEGPHKPDARLDRYDPPRP